LLAAVVGNCIACWGNSYNVVIVTVSLPAESELAFLIKIGGVARVAKVVLVVLQGGRRWWAYIGRARSSSGVAMTELIVASATARAASLNMLFVGVESNEVIDSGLRFFVAIMFECGFWDLKTWTPALYTENIQ
jgi:hypothetical protein